MFYRYEAWNEKEQAWEGIFAALTPDHRRKANQFLHNPKWYDNHPDTDSICWFTQLGYDKYHEEIEALIENCIESYYPLKYRILKANKLDNIAMQGKIQCICLVS